MSPAKKAAPKKARKLTRPGSVAPEKCPHPEKKRRFLGYMTICDDCKTRVG